MGAVQRAGYMARCTASLLQVQTLQRACRLAHSAPWMQGRAKKRKADATTYTDELVVLFTGRMHGVAANTLSRLRLDESLSKKRVASASCGANHAVLLLESGEVVTFGDNRNGQCGRPLNENVYDMDQKHTGYIFPDLDVDSCASGSRHTFLYKKGTRRCFVAGHNEFHQLGLGADRPHDVSVSAPHIIDGVEAFGMPWLGSQHIPAEEGGIARISTGTAHTLVLMESGAVYGFGSALDGQLGTGTTVAHNTPYAIKYFRAHGIRLSDVVAGNACSFFITEDGQLYGSGKLDEGRLGLPWSLQKPVTLLPKRIPLPFADGVGAGMVSPGISHASVVSASGDWRVCGGAQKLGITAPMCKDHADVYPYRRTEEAPPNVEVKQGHTMRPVSASPLPLEQIASGSYHSVGKARGCGDVWGTGWAADGQLGSGSESGSAVSSVVLLHSNPDVVLAAAGGNFSVIVVQATPSTPRTWDGFPVTRVF